ncbi:hypothetical protein [Mycolicibacterium sp.]|uniref:hypothetical protein n=1 Tax=Mycolicibacterium sp. TaxID=2320850 RepID=UPI003D0D67A7
MKANYYPPNSSVRITVPGDPFAGRTGKVERTFNDCGEMIHRVEFGDGNSAYYEADELAAVTDPRAIRVQPIGRPQSQEQDW